jgi:preprotein translocase subunit SecB
MKDKSSATIQLYSQFIKDLSFENPNAPQSIIKITQNPSINFNVNVNANRLNDNYFNISLDIKSIAKEEANSDNIIFQIELLYSAIFLVSDYADEDELKHILLVDCPNLIFPFARRIVSDITRDGGFPPLIMDPIDFAKLKENNTVKH